MRISRRNFLKTAAASPAALATTLKRIEHPAEAARPFSPCINQATTMRADFRTALDAYSKAGFRAVELWLESVEPFLKKESVAVVRRVMSDHGTKPVSSCCEGDLFFPHVVEREKKLEGLKRKLDLSAQLGAPRFVMYSAISERVTPSDYDAALAGLREVGELARRSSSVVGVEFIKEARFLGCLRTAAELLRRAAHPNLRVLFDTFHFYAGTSKLEDLDDVKPGEISFVHINDVPDIPRELLEDEHRVYIGEGVMPLGKILRALAKVYSGPLSFEVFQYASEDPYLVARESYAGLSRLLSSLEGR